MISNENTDKKEKERRKDKVLNVGSYKLNILAYFNVIREVWV